MCEYAMSSNLTQSSKLNKTKLNKYDKEKKKKERQQRQQQQQTNVIKHSKERQRMYVYCTVHIENHYIALCHNHCWLA